MRNMNQRVVLFFVFVLLSITVFAEQNMLFMTYNDLKSGKGIPYDELYLMSPFGKGLVVSFMANGKKEKHHTKEFWGFIYKDALYRVAQCDMQLVKLISNGKIHYYENGWAHISMAKHDSNTGEVVGSKCYVSKGINTPIFNLPENKVAKKQDDIKGLMASNPEYVPLFECIGKGYDIERIRKCVATFEGKK